MSKRVWVVGGIVAIAAIGVALAAAFATSSTHSASGGARLAKAESDSWAEKAGLPNEGPEGTAEAAAYAERAYPALDIPFQLTLDAQHAWAKLQAKANGRGKNSPGQWTLAGPSKADMPGVLTFSGADYTTSGRITALAIDPNCSRSSCRIWAGAAGGGVWRTDNALAGNGANWTFISGSFATNAIGTLTFDASTGTLYAGTGEPNASADSEAGLGIYKSTDGGNTWTHLAALTTVPADTVDSPAGSR